MGSENTAVIEVRNDKLLKSSKMQLIPQDATHEMNQYFSNKITEFKRKRSKATKSNVDSRLFKNIHEQNDEQLMEEATKVSAKKLKRSASKKAEVSNSQSDTEKTHTVDGKESKKPSKRQIKKLKAEQRETEKKEASKLRAMQKAMTYISKWKHARNEWKFTKVIQMWLIENILDETLIPDTLFPTVLEYFEGCKGMARQQLLEKGMNIIRKMEDNEENGKDGIKNVTYKRARELLQAVPTDA